MHNFKLLLFTGILLSTNYLSGCGAEVGPNGSINPALGPTKMTRCALISNVDVSYKEMTKLFSDFSVRQSMKFHEGLPLGTYSNMIQVDNPYVIIKHSYFYRRKPPEHMVTTFRTPDTDAGLSIANDLYEKLDLQGELKDCGGYLSSLTAGFRLKEKHN